MDHVGAGGEHGDLDGRRDLVVEVRVALTTYLANKLLDHTLRNTAYTSPATVYLALFTTMPTTAGTGGVEVVGGSYARQPTSFAAAASGSASSSAPVTFSAMPTATVVGAGLYDAVTSGNLLMLSPFSLPVTVTGGTDFPVPIGDVVAVMG
jgi:hypothetical protein